MNRSFHDWEGWFPFLFFLDTLITFILSPARIVDSFLLVHHTQGHKKSVSWYVIAAIHCSEDFALLFRFWYQFAVNIYIVNIIQDEKLHLYLS